jgi:serine protease Do
MRDSVSRFVHLFRISLILVLIYFLSTDPPPVCAQKGSSDLVKEAIPSVVVINVFNRDDRWRGNGTGFFVKEEGFLVTNRHVIDGQARALAKLSNGTFLPVEGMLSEDGEGDLVLLTLAVKGKSFPTLSLAEEEIETGQPIVVIGSPQSLRAGHWN